MDNTTKKILVETVHKLLASGKGILAADESFGTIEKRFAKIGISSTEENRRSYREMLFTAKGLGDFISGVVLFDETIRQKTKENVSFVETLQNAGILPGIKVDGGTEAMPDSSEEKITKGLDGLSSRLSEYKKGGAHFAKWRAVITIGDGLPTEENIVQNSKILAEYAQVCQKEGIVPIVEPEVLMDGAHRMERCEEVTERVLRVLFNTLRESGVFIEGTILKTNMVLPGKDSGQKITAKEIADATLRVFKKTFPENLPGVAFLSGGQSEIEATENLNALNQMSPLPWILTFSYGRALQDSALTTWNGKAENVEDAQKTLLKRAKMNSLATSGEYSRECERD